ncbi:MAG: guanylate kinase [Armatimonadota bacterium]
MSLGQLIILSGPSGVGKDTVLDRWRARNPLVKRVVTYTTRAPRPGEEDGEDYHFRSNSEFLALAEQGAFLEWKEVHGNLYATPLADMEQMLADGLWAILKIDVQGAAEAVQRRPDALSIFLLPPSREELERRLRGRGTEDEAKVQQRLENALRELDAAGDYAHQVVNLDVETCVDELERIVREHPCPPSS